MNLHSDPRASRQITPGHVPFQVSFEFFPPKTDVMEERFWDSIGKLAPLQPRFVSVTYGAGGTTRERTLRMVSRIQSETGVNAAAHLTCVGASRDEVDAVVHLSPRLRRSLRTKFAGVADFAICWKSAVVTCEAPAGQPSNRPEVEKQAVLDPAKTTSGSSTVI